MPDERTDLFAPLRTALHRLAAEGLGAEQGRRALGEHAARLRQQAGHLPQAARLADALDRCATLPSIEAAPQLLKLLVAMQQLGSVPELPGVPSPEPHSRPLPLAPEGGASSPIAPELLLELRAAFARRTVPSTAVLELLANPETVRDVRTWPLLEAGLAHPHLRAAASAALIRLGPTIAPRLRERFNRRGDATDAARLEVLVAVERKGTTQLLLDAARRGSAPVRRSALEALATHSALSADAREAVILEVFDASAESSRPELAGALAKLGTRHALRRLWPLVSAGHLAEPHLRSLLPPTHVGRWLSLVEEAVPGFSRTAAFFQVMEGFEHPEVLAYLAARSRDSDPGIRRLAAEARLGFHDPYALQTLASSCLEDPELLDVGVTALHRLDAERAFRTLTPHVDAWLQAHPDPTTASPLPRWLQLAHDLCMSEDATRPPWWPRLEAWMSQRTSRVVVEGAPLQPALIRERKAP